MKLLIVFLKKTKAASYRNFKFSPFLPSDIAKAAFQLQRLGCDNFRSDPFAFSFESYGQPVSVWIAPWELSGNGVLNYELKGIQYERLQFELLCLLENLALADEYLFSLARREGTATIRPNWNWEEGFCLESLALPAGELSRMGIALPKEVSLHPDCLFPMQMKALNNVNLRQQILSSIKPMVVSL